MTYLHEFLQPFGGWASRSLRPVHTLFSKWLPKAIATTKAPKAGSFSEMRGTYPTHPFLLLTSTGSSSWSFLVAKCCPHIFGFILTWKRHHVHRCLDNPPPLSFPPASWARFAGTLPTLSWLPSDVLPCALCQTVPDRVLTWYEDCMVFIFLPFANPSTLPASSQGLGIGWGS